MLEKRQYEIIDFTQRNKEKYFLVQYQGTGLAQAEWKLFLKKYKQKEYFEYFDDLDFIWVRYGSDYYIKPFDDLPIQLKCNLDKRLKQIDQEFEVIQQNLYQNAQNINSINNYVNETFDSILFNQIPIKKDIMEKDHNVVKVIKSSHIQGQKQQHQNKQQRINQKQKMKLEQKNQNVSSSLLKNLKKNKK